MKYTIKHKYTGGLFLGQWDNIFEQNYFITEFGTISKKEYDLMYYPINETAEPISDPMTTKVLEMSIMEANRKCKYHSDKSKYWEDRLNRLIGKQLKHT